MRALAEISKISKRLESISLFKFISPSMSILFVGLVSDDILQIELGSDLLKIGEGTLSCVLRNFEKKKW